MKTLNKLLLVLSVLFSLSCTKQTDAIPDDTNLTTCPANGECRYLFTEYADVSQNMNLKTGTYRVFWSSFQTGTLSTTVYIKTPMDRPQFSLNRSDILAGGLLLFRQGCPSCNLIPLEVVDGYIKGINRDPRKRADQTRWLLEGQVVLQGINTPSLKDTINLKQYFYPNFIYD